MNTWNFWIIRAPWLLLGLIFVNLITSCTSREPEIVFTEKNFARFEQKLETLREALNIPGMSAIIMHKRAIVWEKGFGYADIEQRIKATPKTTYQLASVTKGIAAMVIMNLVESDSIDLNEPVIHFGIDLGDNGQVCVKHLLSHTSDVPPGSFFRYNGNRFSMMDYVVKASTGRTVMNHIKTKVIIPLGLSNTTSCLDSVSFPDAFAYLAKPYDYDDAGNLIPGHYTSYSGAAAGLISSCEDLAQVDRALDAGILFDSATMKRAFTPFELNDGTTVDYGFGWFLQEVHGIQIEWGFGYGYSTSSLYLRLPQLETTFILLANSWRLSSPFPIGLIEEPVTTSPFAQAFFSSFIRNIPGCHQGWIDLNWTENKDVLIDEISKIDEPVCQQEVFDNLVAWWNIAKTGNDTAMMEKLHSVFAQSLVDSIFLPPSGKLIGDILHPGVNERDSCLFKIDNTDSVFIYATGDGAPWGMYDHVFIKNLKTDSLVWYMDGLETIQAGGHPRNRHFEGSILLPGGSYCLYYDNTKSPYKHGWGHWEAFPPKNLFWGVVVKAQ